MTTKFISMPLYSDASYSYIISLGTVSYIFQSYFNERANAWFFNLLLEDQTPLITGERLVPNYPLVHDYRLNGVDGFIFLYPKSKTNNENYLSNARNLSDDYFLFYVYED